MDYRELTDAFKERINKFADNSKVTEYAEKLLSENTGFGWSAIYANYAMKQIVRMTDKELTDYFSQSCFV